MILWRKNHPDVKKEIDRLFQVSNQLFQQQQYNNAIDTLTILCKLIKQTFGANHPDYVKGLNNLAYLYSNLGDYSKAEPLYQEALEIYRRELGENNSKYATVLNNLALLYQYMGDYSKAEPLYRKALDIRRQVLGENNPEYADSLNNLALLYQYMGDYSNAEPLYQVALEIYRRELGEENQYYANNLNNLAGLYTTIGDYSKAEPLYRKALEIRRKVQGENHPDYAKSLNNLARLNENMGDYNNAESTYQKALEINRQVLGGNHPECATVLNNLALLYQYMGDYSKAEPLYQEALEIRHKVLGENHPDYAQSLNNLAYLYLDLGEYTKAEPLYQKALDIRRQVLGENHLEYANSLHNLATLYSDLGEYTKAEPLYQKALEINRRILGENHTKNAITLSGLAGLNIASGRHVMGMNLMKQAAAIDDQMIQQIFSIGSERQRMAFIQYIEWSFHEYLSIVLQYFHSSQEPINSALDLVLRRKAIGAEALAAQRDAILSGKYPELEPKLRELKFLRMKIGQETLDGTTHSEDMMAQKQYLEELNGQKEEIEEYLANKIPEIGLEQKLKAANRHAIANQLSKDEALVEFVRFQVKDFFAVRARAQSTWKPAHYIAFILLGGEPDNVRMIDLGDAEPIDRMVSGLRQSITGRESRQLLPISIEPKDIVIEFDDEGLALRAALFDPLLGALNGIKRLLLAPDGNLCTLPFEVLPMDKNGKCLIDDDYFLIYLNTGRDMLRFGSVVMSGLSNDPLIAADPDFDFDVSSSIVTSVNHKTNIHQNRHSREMYSSTAIHFEQLQGTRVEGEQIAELLHVSPWLRGRVLETSLKACKSPSLLHIATHGFFLPDQPHDPPNKNGLMLGEINNSNNTIGMVDRIKMNRLSGEGLENPLLRSGLALTGANTWLRNGLLPPEAEDGILTAEDVSGMDLSNTELVVLSACETGLGKIISGEGVFGLRRAFALAGAQTLVMSLWKVPDQQTKELMIDFYNRILDGKPRAVALREAQISTKKKYPSPYYWGAFICQGNPSSLSNEFLEGIKER